MQPTLVTSFHMAPIPECFWPLKNPNLLLSILCPSKKQRPSQIQRLSTGLEFPTSLCTGPLVPRTVTGSESSSRHPVPSHFSVSSGPGTALTHPLIVPLNDLTCSQNPDSKNKTKRGEWCLLFFQVLRADKTFLRKLSTLKIHKMFCKDYT